MNFTQLRKKALEKYFGNMNPNQQKAIFQTRGAVLILAGAGSGKTSVLVNRVANIVKFGDAYHSNYVPSAVSEHDIKCLTDYIDGDVTSITSIADLMSDEYKPKPYHILAITFTNKAATELKERLHAMLGDDANDIMASTFHSCCVKILRRYIDRLGYNSNFTIYDSDDQLRLIKECMKANNVDEKHFTPRSILSAISSAKDTLLTPQDYEKKVQGDFRTESIAKIYKQYQQSLKTANAVDFDDIITLTVKLFQEEKEVLEYYQNRYKYIMVDEYQDTNHAQYMLVSLLATKHKNLCVVGDDDQSIYKFRGATIENILSFENEFENAQVIKLEQNYRCTQTILDAANSVISNNTKRKGKTLWTDNGLGEKVNILRASSEQSEADYITNNVLANVEQGRKFSDHAVLYRMNSQSNVIERSLLRSGIPYRLIGGKRFFERKEIKDVVSYLSVINNKADTLRLVRIINEPKRGIGDTTLNTAKEISSTLEISLYDVFATCQQYAPLMKKSKAIKEFADMIEDLSQKADNIPLDELYQDMLDQSGYYTQYNPKLNEDAGRLENINELKSNIVNYMNETENPTLNGFLEEISLYTDLDTYEHDQDKMVLMTLHTAKGLEFPVVFITGVEENIFPSNMSSSTQEEIEEERRLAYVGYTRAKESLHVTSAGERMMFGRINRNRQSRFIAEINSELCSVIDQTIRTIRPHDTKAEDAAKLKSAIGKSIGVGADDRSKESVLLNFTLGDVVAHSVFGKGEVLKITPMGNDHLIEVQFDKAGLKKIMANFAKLTKI